MGQQSKKIIKRRRRADYLKRKADAVKLGGAVKRPANKKADVAAKKAPAKKAAAKKAPAKKIAKKSPGLEEAQVAAAAPESTEPAAAEAVEHVATTQVEALEEIAAEAPKADEEA